MEALLLLGYREVGRRGAWEKIRESWGSTWGSSLGSSHLPSGSEELQ